MRGAIQAEFLTQVASTIAPLYTLTQKTFDNFVIALTVISALVYFLFTVEAKGPLAAPMTYLGKIGRYLLMIGRPAVRANRMSFLIRPADLSRDNLIDRPVAVLSVSKRKKTSARRTAEAKAKRTIAISQVTEYACEMLWYRVVTCERVLVLVSVDSDVA
jgi:hypothetical protein